MPHKPGSPAGKWKTHDEMEDMGGAHLVRPLGLLPSISQALEIPFRF